MQIPDVHMYEYVHMYIVHMLKKKACRESAEIKMKIVDLSRICSRALIVFLVQSIIQEMLKIHPEHFAALL